MEIEKKINYQENQVEENINEDKNNQIANENQQQVKDNKKARIFIKNLVFDINKKILEKEFKKYGHIQDINIPTNPASNRSQGYAFVQYSNVNMAKKAIKETNDKIFKGRKLSVQFAVDQRLYKKPQQKVLEKEKLDDQPENENLRNQPANDPVQTLKEDKLQTKVQDKKPKDHEKEDKQAILFIKNIDYECDEQDLKNNFQKIGKVLSAKLVKSQNSDKHKGSGFVKFLQKETAQHVLDIYLQVKNNPEKRSILDPTNFLTINNRDLEILQCLDSKKLQNEIDTKRQKQLELDQKLQQGLPVVEDNIQQQGFDKNQIQNRQKHFDEKSIKLQNKNYKISDTKILLKNINKKLDKKFLMDFVYQQLSIYYQRKILNKKKIVKEINFLDKKKNSKNSGSIIINFVNSVYANQFMQQICCQNNWKQLQRNEKEVPIIEYVFEDMQKLKRRNEIIEKIQNKKMNQDDIIIQMAKKNKKIEKKNNYKDLKKEIKNLYNIALSTRQLSDAKICFEKLAKLNSRGIKKRLKNSLIKTFPEINSQH